jgi:hypothetical protein
LQQSTSVYCPVPDDRLDRRRIVEHAADGPRNSAVVDRDEGRLVLESERVGSLLVRVRLPRHACRVVMLRGIASSAVARSADDDHDAAWRQGRRHRSSAASSRSQDPQAVDT